MNLLYAPITKTEETPDGLIVEGIASTESVDTQGEVVDYDSLKAVLPDYVQWGNIREMHQPSAVGKALVVTPDDEHRTLLLRALIVDDTAAKKVRTEVYKGFSIGGKARREVQKRGDGSTYTRAFMQLLSEISLADRPSNPDARFTLVKVEGAMPKEDAPEQPATGLSAEQVAALQKLAGNLAAVAKAAADPSKIVAMIQQARNDLELAGDMEGAALYTQAIALVQQAAGEANETPADEAAEPPAEAAPEGEQPMMQHAKTSNVRKAGRVLNAANLTAMENTVKALLQMMAGAGSAKAQKAMAAMTDDAGGGDVAMVAKTIGGEVEKALAPLAAGILSINERLTVVERQPAPGGPVLRPVAKTIAGQPPNERQKPPVTMLVKAQLDSLSHLARTAATPGMRADYQQQYDALRAQYQ